MLGALLFLWRATRGYRLRPWRSPLLRWRIETFSGQHAEEITFAGFCRFSWRERHRLGHFLGWCNQMRNYRRALRHAASSGYAGPAD